MVYIYPFTTTNLSIGEINSPPPSSATQVAGSDGTDLRVLNVDSTGKLNINNVSGTISLPTGAATETTLASVDSKVATETTLATLATEATVATLATEATVSALATEATVSALATEATTSSIDAKIPANLTVSSSRLVVDGSQVTQPISASSLPLPAGAATETTLSSIDADTSALAATISSGKVLVDGSTVTQPISASSLPLPTGAATESTVSSLNTKVVTTANGIKVDGSAVTQPISASSLPLPAGAATAAKQDTGNTSLNNIDSKVPANLTVTSNKLLVDGSGVTQPVSASSLPLPTGAATSANQTNGSQKSQIVNSAGTSVTVTGTALDVNLASGSVTATNSANGATGATVPSDATLVAGSASGTLTALKVSATGVVSVDGSAVTQPVSASSLPLPTGASTASNQTDGSQKSQLVNSAGTSATFTGTALDINIASGTVTATNSANGATGAAVPTDATLVGGSASGTLTALKVSATGVVSVDGSAVTQPVSAASLPLPTGAATSALQTTGNTSLSSINTKLPSNLTVTSTRLLVDNSGVTQPISAASLPLPTGAATESTLSTLNGKIPANLTVSSTRLLVDSSGVTQPVAQQGRTKAHTPSFTNYSSTNVTTSTYVQLAASITSACSAIEVYNQCASSIYFATGAGGAEVDQFIIPPGGNGLLPISIAASTRIAVKAVDSSATSGSLIINFWT